MPSAPWAAIARAAAYGPPTLGQEAPNDRAVPTQRNEGIGRAKAVLSEACSWARVCHVMKFVKITLTNGTERKLAGSCGSWQSTGENGTGVRGF